ncbi:MAG TPA: hypothetical protein VGA78_12690 [Gemmatimonadales bacterium]|jgi:hypothetical protein
MLPEDVTADLLNPSLQRFFLDHLHRAKTAVLLRHGGCSCDLAGRRNPDGAEDERSLRTRYRQDRVPRAQVIEAMERHRTRPRGPEVPAGHWSGALAGLVAEHARNAGSALYYLDFTPELERMPPWPPSGPERVGTARVLAHPGSWLPEGAPVVVLP